MHVRLLSLTLEFNKKRDTVTNFSLSVRQNDIVRPQRIQVKHSRLLDAKGTQSSLCTIRRVIFAQGCARKMLADRDESGRGDSTSRARFHGE